MYTGKDLQQGASYHKLVTKTHLFSNRQEVDAFYQHGKLHNYSNQPDSSSKFWARRPERVRSNIRIRLTSNDCGLHTLQAKSGSNKDI